MRSLLNDALRWQSGSAGESWKGRCLLNRNKAGLSPRASQYLEFIRASGYATYEDIATGMGVTIPSAYRQVQTLIDKGYVEAKRGLTFIEPIEPQPPAVGG
jgi:DNA-binding MarR family transcriptional regulator